MKHVLIIVLLIIFNTLFCHSQTNTPYINNYIKMLHTDGAIKLNQGPFNAPWDSLDKATVFFLTVYDTEIESYKNHAVLFLRGNYIPFAYNDMYPFFGRGVISVFFENIDNDTEKEMIVIYESGGRSYYADGGYAGSHSNYITRVFNYRETNVSESITEYKAIGEILTVNIPPLMGTRLEEELIGRESNIEKLNNTLGVTYNAQQIKKRIQLLKKQGFLGKHIENPK